MIDQRRKNMANARAARKPGTAHPSGANRKQVRATEPINPTFCYAMMLLPDLVGVSRRSVDNAILTGMPTCRVGGKEFVLGYDLIAFITRPEHRRQDIGTTNE